MDRKDLTKEVHIQLKESGFSTNLADSKKITDVVINTITDNIAKGKTVNISEFGKFESIPRKVKDPRPGFRDKFFTSWRVYFSAAYNLKKSLNKNHKE